MKFQTKNGPTVVSSLAAFAAVGCFAAAQASTTIGVTYFDQDSGWQYHENMNYSSVPASDQAAPAGVVLQTGWNAVQLTAGGGSSQEVTGLLDSEGGSTTVSATLSGSFHYFSGNNVETDGAEDPVGFGSEDPAFATERNNLRLLSTQLGASGTGTPATIELTGISYASYDIIVYLGMDANDRNAAISLAGGPTYYYLTQSVTTTEANAVAIGAVEWVAANATTAEERATANYVMFTGLTGDSQTITLIGDTGQNVGLTGFQIIGVPEPSTALLSLVGFAGLLRRRRP